MYCTPLYNTPYIFYLLIDNFRKTLRLKRCAKPGPFYLIFCSNSLNTVL